MLGANTHNDSLGCTLDFKSDAPCPRQEIILPQTVTNNGWINFGLIRM